MGDDSIELAAVAIGSEAVIDLGEVDLNRESGLRLARVSIANQMREQREFVSVRTTCHCAAGALSSRSVAPADEVVLDVRLDVRTTGRTTQSVVIIDDRGDVTRVILTAVGRKSRNLSAFAFRRDEETVIRMWLEDRMLHLAMANIRRVRCRCADADSGWVKSEWVILDPGDGEQAGIAFLDVRAPDSKACGAESGSEIVVETDQGDQLVARPAFRTAGIVRGRQ